MTTSKKPRPSENKARPGPDENKDTAPAEAPAVAPLTETAAEQTADPASGEEHWFARYLAEQDKQRQQKGAE